MDNEQLVQKIYTPGSASAAKLYNLVWQPLENTSETLQLSIFRRRPANNISFNALYNGRTSLAARLICIAIQISLPPAPTFVWRVAAGDKPLGQYGL